jgi:hypothetical protein
MGGAARAHLQSIAQELERQLAAGGDFGADLARRIIGFRYPFGVTLEPL